MLDAAYCLLIALVAMLPVAGLGAARLMRSTGIRLYCNRLRARHEQKRIERRELRAWLEITSQPL